jgi:S-DNA-T family DNA segregation ATPase FtsK/SpoIIIE
MQSVNYLKIFVFLNKRIIEIVGLLIVLLSFFLLLSLLTYYPEDQYFSSQENIKIHNLLGSYGSFISDLILQSFGIISFLFCITIFFTGIFVIKDKKLENILINLFYSTIYVLSGSTVLSNFERVSQWVIFNGNGGFVGEYVKKFTYIFNGLVDEKIIFFLLAILSVIFFLLSIQFSIKTFFKSIKFLSLHITKFFSSKSRHEKINLNVESKSGTKIYEDIKTETTQSNLPFRDDKKSFNTKKFILPPFEYLKRVSKKHLQSENLDSDKANPEFLEKIFLDFSVEGKIKKISRGPVVTLYEFEPAPGIRVSKIINLSDDIARNTSSLSTRVATIPGKNTVGIEIPNQVREEVFLSEIISDEKFKKKEIILPIALGKSISGLPIVGDLTDMLHMLIAGTTGSGKSVCINTIILSLLYKLTPEKCKFILIDPKMLELSTYEGIPHLLCPVITEAKKATSALGWTVKEMESRYRLMTREGVRNIEGYNNNNKTVMPYIVVIVDEMSDLMLVAGKEIENYVQKLSQMARAAGIHIIMATQRPSVDVITGTIKANFPTRISFQVSSKIDSRTILGEQGAEQLLGKGDMLFMSSANRIMRIHSPYVSENEIEKINSFLRSQEEPDYVHEIMGFADEKNFDQSFAESEKKDQLYKNAIELVKSEGKASTSFLQRKLQIGYNRAARIIDMMEDEGIVSKPNHVGKREIL